MALYLPHLISPDERSDELTGRKQMCNLQPINVSLSLSLSLLYTNSHIHVRQHYTVSGLFCETLLSFVAAIENSLIRLLEDKHTTLNLSDLSSSSSSLCLSAKDEQKIFTLFT